LKPADVELLRPLWVPKSLSHDEECKQTVKLWLSDGNYYVNNCPPELSLFCQIAEEIKKACHWMHFALLLIQHKLFLSSNKPAHIQSLLLGGLSKLIMQPTLQRMRFCDFLEGHFPTLKLGTFHF
jgi:hypothetical protein